MTVEDAALLSGEERATLAAIADHLIPAAHDMPSAGEILTDERLRFALNARPDLAAPLHLALRADLGDDVAMRLDQLRRNEPATLSALQLVIVGGYYTDKHVRELIGYPGQQALTVRSWEYPPYLEEGLIDAVLARGPVWRDPATGVRATATGAPQTYAQTFAGAEAPEGESDGHDRP